VTQIFSLSPSLSPRCKSRWREINIYRQIPWPLRALTRDAAIYTISAGVRSLLPPDVCVCVKFPRSAEHISTHTYFYYWCFSPSLSRFCPNFQRWKGANGTITAQSTKHCLTQSAISTPLTLELRTLRRFSRLTVLN
jgi:hypothetical protein